MRFFSENFKRGLIQSTKHSSSGMASIKVLAITLILLEKQIEIISKTKVKQQC